jgi:hypothetical protein
MSNNEYRGWHGILDGDHNRPVFVMNSGTHRETGESLLKVKIGYWSRYHGYYGGCDRDVAYSGPVKWVYAKQVTARKRAKV